MNTYPLDTKKLMAAKRQAWFEIWSRLPYSWRETWWKVKAIFSPEHKKLRKALPRTWADTTELIRILNFAMLTEFYEDEFLDGWVDWDSDESHKQFKDWLTASYIYIKLERPELEKRYWEAMPNDDFFSQFEKTTDSHGQTVYKHKGDPKQCYNERYGKADKIEQEMLEKDTSILTGIIEKRDRFWT
jgi:hypothetical protein